MRASRGHAFLGNEPAGVGAGKKDQIVLLTPSWTQVLVKGRDRFTGPVQGHLPWAMGRVDAKGRSHATLWQIPSAAGADPVAGTELPAAGYRETFVNAQDGWSVVGTGTPPGEAPDRALLWTNGGEPIELAAPDPGASTLAYGVRDGIQVGKTGGIYGHACLWRGSSATFVDLNPPGFETSRAHDACDGEQVGDAVREVLEGQLRRAALWRGRAETFVDLTPEGCALAEARSCAGGYQAGFAQREVRTNLYHAWIWQGSASEGLDLHPADGGWTASMVHRMRLVSGRLILVGTVERRPAGSLVLEAERAAVWEVEVG